MLVYLTKHTGRYVGQLRCEGSGARGVTELDLRYFIFGVHIGHLICDRREIELSHQQKKSEHTHKDTREYYKRTFSMGFFRRAAC
jgi:hypothetical protein